MTLGAHTHVLGSTRRAIRGYTFSVPLTDSSQPTLKRSICADLCVEDEPTDDWWSGARLSGGQNGLGDPSAGSCGGSCGSCGNCGSCSQVS